jgi:glutamine amidotransferase PdxT
MKMSVSLQGQISECFNPVEQKFVVTTIQIFKTHWFSEISSFQILWANESTLLSSLIDKILTLNIFERLI